MAVRGKVHEVGNVRALLSGCAGVAIMWARVAKGMNDNDIKEHRYLLIFVVDMSFISNRQNAIRLEEKEKREKELLSQIIIEADEYKVEFHRKQLTTVETNKVTNREKEKVFVASQEKFHAEADKDYWKSIAELIPKEVPSIEKRKNPHKAQAQYASPPEAFSTGRPDANTDTSVAPKAAAAVAVSTEAVAVA
ncbi:Clathrin light chain 2 [Sesamum angolense]|uniref:Clathrin light chain 2 n=1 Tax=Sesamum angolense TaxID=2727404 RepID=A0AAE1X1U3_9LAMI|nr:Clathrin light chain 2 [Sesamum angolense]